MRELKDIIKELTDMRHGTAVDVNEKIAEALAEIERRLNALENISAKK